jgi:hypothetical protein
MGRSMFVKPLAVVCSLLLGAGIIWYQAGLIRGEPAAAPESRADAPGIPDRATGEDDPSVGTEEPNVHIFAGEHFFSTSKSMTPPTIFGFVPVPAAFSNFLTGQDSTDANESVLVAVSPHYLVTSKSAMLRGTTLSEEMIDAVPGLRDLINASTNWQPPSEETELLPEEAADE